MIAGLGSKLIALGVAAVVATGGYVTLGANGEEPKRATVFFPRAVHLYEGSDVVVLGVRVGEVTEVDPEGEKVRVELAYDPDRKIPADAQAVLVSPTLVADRYVQLAPVYRGGPVLDDGATIPLSRAQVPVELDEIFRSVTDLADALGPEGANRDGALSDLLRVAADNLDGNGAAAGEAISGAADLTQTLSDNREELFGTIRNLQALTSELAARDEEVRSFNQNLARVSAQLAAERTTLGDALAALAVALDKVDGFIRQNRDELSANVENLAAVADALAKEKESIGKTLHIAPVGVANFSHMYDPVSEALSGRINGNDKYESPAYFLCALLAAVGVPPEDCPGALAPLADIPLDPSGSPPAPPVATPPAREPADPTGLAGLLFGGLR